MKVALNLAISPKARERYALHWAIPATLLGATGLAFLLLFTVRSYREYSAVHHSVAEQNAGAISRYVAHRLFSSTIRNQEPR